DAVGIDQLEAELARRRVRTREEVERRRALPLWVSGREEGADVGESRGAEHGVDQSVGDHVSVGVAGETARGIDADAAEHQRHAVLERVRVDPDADAVLRHARGPPAAPRESARATLRPEARAGFPTARVARGPR